MNEVRLLMATVTAEMPRYYEFYDSVDRLTLPPNTGKCQIHSSSPARNRNIVIANALKNNFTHIFFMDDDQTYDSDTLTKLIARDVDIISGLYCMKFAPFPLIGFDKVANDETGETRFMDMNQYGPNKLAEVVAVPAGCLLVKADVFKNIPPPWFTLGKIWPDTWGDDLWFSKLAREAGYKMYIDTGVLVGHMTKCELKPAYINGEWIIQHKINSDYSIEFMR